MQPVATVTDRLRYKSVIQLSFLSFSRSDYYFIIVVVAIIVSIVVVVVVVHC